MLATTPTTCLAEPVRPTTIREQQPKPLPQPYASGKWQVWIGFDGWQHWSYQSENWDSKKEAAEQSRRNRTRWENWGSWADQVASSSQAAGSRDEWVGRHHTQETPSQTWNTPAASGGKGERARSASPTAPM
eukprot:3253272-Amphidinium_carterae.1